MERESISLLGIPVDNVTMGETLEHIFNMIDYYAVDKIPKYVATVNVDFIVNTLSWKTDHSRHPELLDILRRADLVTPDGMPLIWISKILDSPLKERVAGSDMVPELAQRAEATGKSLFLFGGESGTAEKATETLVSRYSGLRIAGTYSPEVATEGEAILNSAEKDREIVKKINDSGADILLIALGNPKQEIWYERNRKSLQVPVSIGVGGTFGFITGSVSRAPVWMQKNGLEWIYRIMQDPGRLWKRYLTGLIKLSANILFPFLIQKITKTIVKLKKQSKNFQNEIKKDINSREDMAIISMPSQITRESLLNTKNLINNIKEPSLNLDFKNTNYMDLFAMGFIISIWRYCNIMKKPLYLTGINPLMIRLLKYNRLWDICGRLYYSDQRMISDRIKKNSNESSFYYTIDADADLFKIELHGRLDAANISKLNIQKLTKFIGNRNCILNLKNLRFIDSTGLIFFLKLKKHLSVHNKTPIMCNVNEDVLQIFSITKLLSLFKILPEFDSAKHLIKESA